MRKIKELLTEINELKNRLKEIEEFFIKRNKPICYIETMQSFWDLDYKYICWKDKQNLKINKILINRIPNKIAVNNKGEIFVAIEDEWYIINKIKNEIEKVYVSKEYPGKVIWMGMEKNERKYKI